MNTIQNIFESGAAQYRESFGNTMPLAHKKVMNAIERCRTPDMGMTVFTCPHCSSTQSLPRSCADRHCPTCQSDKGELWLESNSRHMLPCSYFMVTFTVPEQMRLPIRSNQRELYAALFTTAWQSMALLARDKRHLGAHILGAIAVLHTWTRQIEYHPHIHFLVPAGGLDKQGNWIRGRQDFFLPVRALSRIYRAKMRDEIKKLGLMHLVPPDAWNIEWNVNCENKGNGVRALSYLSTYLFKVAIANSRIVRADDQTVTFKYKKQKSDKFKNTTVTVTEFIRRFLQHVLPKGFVKVRHYGMLAANGKHDLKQIAAMIFEGFKPPDISLLLPKPKHRGVICSCGTLMMFAAFVPPQIPLPEVPVST
jgi:hypothetical protein